MLGDDNRAAGVAHAGRLPPIPAPDQAVDDAGGIGVASAEDVDKTIRDGLGLRWSFMGPFETIELNAPGGIPDYAARYGASLTRMNEDILHPAPFSSEAVGSIMAQWPGEQSKERIARLAEWP